MKRYYQMFDYNQKNDLSTCFTSRGKLIEMRDTKCEEMYTSNRSLKSQFSPVPKLGKNESSKVGSPLQRSKIISKLNKLATAKDQPNAIYDCGNVCLKRKFNIVSTDVAVSTQSISVDRSKIDAINKYLSGVPLDQARQPNKSGKVSLDRIPESKKVPDECSSLENKHSISDASLDKGIELNSVRGLTSTIPATSGATHLDLETKLIYSQAKMSPTHVNSGSDDVNRVSKPSWTCGPRTGKTIAVGSDRRYIYHKVCEIGKTDRAGCRIDPRPELKSNHTPLPEAAERAWNNASSTTSSTCVTLSPTTTTSQMIMCDGTLRNVRSVEESLRNGADVTDEGVLENGKGTSSSKISSAELWPSAFHLPTELTGGFKSIAACTGGSVMDYNKNGSGMVWERGQGDQVGNGGKIWCHEAMDLTGSDIEGYYDQLLDRALEEMDVSWCCTKEPSVDVIQTLKTTICNSTHRKEKPVSRYCLGSKQTTLTCYDENYGMAPKCCPIDAVKGTDTSVSGSPALPYYLRPSLSNSFGPISFESSGLFGQGPQVPFNHSDRYYEYKPLFPRPVYSYVSFHKYPTATIDRRLARPPPPATLLRRDSRTTDKYTLGLIYSIIGMGHALDPTLPYPPPNFPAYNPENCGISVDTDCREAEQHVTKERSNFCAPDIGLFVDPHLTAAILSIAKYALKPVMLSRGAIIEES